MKSGASLQLKESKPQLPRHWPHQNPHHYKLDREQKPQNQTKRAQQQNPHQSKEWQGLNPSLMSEKAQDKDKDNHWECNQSKIISFFLLLFLFTFNVFSMYLYLFYYHHSIQQWLCDHVLFIFLIDNVIEFRCIFRFIFNFFENRSVNFQKLMTCVGHSIFWVTQVGRPSHHFSLLTNWR